MYIFIGFEIGAQYVWNQKFSFFFFLVIRLWPRPKFYLRFLLFITLSIYWQFWKKTVPKNFVRINGIWLMRAPVPYLFYYWDCILWDNLWYLIWKKRSMIQKGIVTSGMNWVYVRKLKCNICQLYWIHKLFYIDRSHRK